MAWIGPPPMRFTKRTASYTGTMAKYRAKAPMKVSRRRKFATAGQLIQGGQLATKAVRYLNARRIKRRESLFKKIPVGAGSTTSYYTSGTSRMSQYMYNMFRSAQVYDTTSTIGFRIDSNLYGRQGLAERQFYDNLTFSTDYARAISTTPTTAQVQTASLYYSAMSVISTFTNQELTTTYLDIYEIEPRFHITGVNSPLTLWQAGVSNEGGSATTLENVYETPFKSRTFSLFYLVKKITKIELSPGQSHRHMSTYNINKRVDGAICAAYNTLRDVTKYQMYVASGTPINDSTTVTNVSTSTIAIDVVTKVNYKFIRDVNIRDTYTITTSLSTSMTPNVVTDKSIKPDAEA